MNWGFLGAALARAVSASRAKSAAAGRAIWSPLTYSEQGPTGYIHYSKEGRHFSLYYEFGGGDALAVIFVPGADEWTAKTGLPLEQRITVLEGIARQVIADKTTTGRNRFEISDTLITIFEM